MTGPLGLGQSVTFTDGTVEKSGIVSVVWMDGRRAIVATPDGEMLTWKADQPSRPNLATTVTVDLDKAEEIALDTLAGDRVEGSVTTQMLVLAAAVIALREGRAA